MVFKWSIPHKTDNRSVVLLLWIMYLSVVDFSWLFVPQLPPDSRWWYSTCSKGDRKWRIWLFLLKDCKKTSNTQSSFNTSCVYMDTFSSLFWVSCLHVIWSNRIRCLHEPVYLFIYLFRVNQINCAFAVNFWRSNLLKCLVFLLSRRLMMFNSFSILKGNYASPVVWWSLHSPS